MTTICFINQKGGCGKSSTCFHLAGEFATQGLNVLLVDADPQGSLSQGFWGSVRVESLDWSATTAAVFRDEEFRPSSSPLRQPTSFDRITLIPANQQLSEFNQPKPERLGFQQFVLRELVEEAGSFDIALIDCPPNLYLCSWAALQAATHVVIPVPPEDFGTQGLRAVHQAIENARQLNPTLCLLGHLVTRSDRRLLVHRTYERRLREIYRDQVLQTVIPEASAFKVALACRKPVCNHRPRSTAGHLTSQLGREILTRVGFAPQMMAAL
jgi:chromosome partitioning protein